MGRKFGKGVPLQSANAGAGSRSGLKGMLSVLHLLDKQKFRLPADVSEAQVALASKAREIIMKVMINPGRHSQAQLAAARQLLEEACGKVADSVKIDEHNVTVEIRTTPAPKKEEPK
jgi:hypothetical protein